MNSYQRLLLRRVVSEIAADTIAAYGISGGLSPVGDPQGSTGGGEGSGGGDDDLDEADELSFTKADRDEDNRGKRKIWRF